MKLFNYVKKLKLIKSTYTHIQIIDKTFIGNVLFRLYLMIR